jgi:hypothetical protein
VTQNFEVQPQLAAGVPIALSNPPQQQQQQQEKFLVQQPQQQYYIQQPVSIGPPPRDYLILSIVSVFVCSCTVGLLALLFSVKTRHAWAEGNVTDAFKFSKWSKLANIASWVIGMSLYAGAVILIILDVVL